MNKSKAGTDVATPTRRDELLPVSEPGHGPPAAAPQWLDAPSPSTGQRETISRLRHIAAEAWNFTIELDRLNTRFSTPSFEDTTQLARTLEQAAAAAQDLAVTAGEAAAMLAFWDKTVSG